VKARLVLTLGLVLSAASCGGDGVIDAVVGPPAIAPTLTALQESLFTPKCALRGGFCHVSPQPAEGMDLSTGNTFTFTVGVDSVELSGFKRVSPRNAADSYLYMKIVGDPRIVPVRMPLVGDLLSPAELAAVRAWIDAGAKDN
jgi:hypothetical protein